MWRLKRIKWCSYAVIALLIILLAFDISFAFEKIRFVVISDPPVSIPQQKGVAAGFKPGLKTRMITENNAAEINKITDVKFVLAAGDLTRHMAAGSGSSRDLGREPEVSGLP